MQLDPLYIGEKVTVSLEAIGDGKVRVNTSSWDNAAVILDEEALQVFAIQKRLYLCRGEKPIAWMNST